MANVKFVTLPQGFRQLARSGGMLNLMEEKAQWIADNCNSLASPDTMHNPPFSAHAEMHPTRAVGHAGTSSPHGWYANKRNHMLQKSLGRLR